MIEHKGDVELTRLNEICHRSMFDEQQSDTPNRIKIGVELCCKLKMTIVIWTKKKEEGKECMVIFSFVQAPLYRVKR